MIRVNKLSFITFIYRIICVWNIFLVYFLKWIQVHWIHERSFIRSYLLPARFQYAQYYEKEQQLFIVVSFLPWLRLWFRPNINKCMYTINDEKRCLSTTTTESCMYVYPHSKRILDNPSYALLSQRAIKLSSPSIQLEMNLHYWWIKGLVAFNIKGRRRPFS